MSLLFDSYSSKASVYKNHWEIKDPYQKKSEIVILITGRRNIIARGKHQIIAGFSVHSLSQINLLILGYVNSPS